MLLLCISTDDHVLEFQIMMELKIQIVQPFDLSPEAIKRLPYILVVNV